MERGPGGKPGTIETGAAIARPAGRDRIKA